MPMPNSVYIHVPFCKSKCHYCSFVSFPKLELKEQYLNKLEEEIIANYQGEKLETLYFGGGTPSLLTPKDFNRIITFFNITDKTEVTAELNPEGVNEKFLQELFKTGVNRLSLGCQTFNDDILKLINRRHNSNQVVKAVQTAQKVGFKNISLDFIYGLPMQTESMFYDDLKFAIDLGIAHISLYGLTIEKGSYFYVHKPENLPDEDLQADMYLGAVNLLTSSGFEHYEISNFSLPGFNSRHNMVYWDNKEYYGFGVAAHGYVKDIRYGNKESIEDYISNPIEHSQKRIETDKDKLEEEIFLGFRRIKKGINVSAINEKYLIDFESKYKKVIDKYLSVNFLKKTPQGYALTPQGALLSNTILAEFLG